MKKKITIAIDAMGGDNSPGKTIRGVHLFLKRNIANKDFLLNLFGDENKIKEYLNKYNISTNLNPAGWTGTTLDMGGTNDAPDGSSGGFNGLAALSSLTGATNNWTITTS